MTPEILQERRIEAEVRRMHQLERCRSRARRRLAEEFPDRYQEILAEEKKTLSEGHFDRRGWTTHELDLLRKLAPFGVVVVAQELERSIDSVKKKAKTLRISLRRPGISVGLILGQPRNVTLTGSLAALRLDVVNGTADAERIDRRKRERTICPMCGTRPQETINGWCLPCDTKELTRSYETEKALRAAERENDATRQEWHREETREKERASG